MKIELKTPHQARKELRPYELESGVYILHLGNDICYVGQTQNLYVRLRQHISHLTSETIGKMAPGEMYAVEAYKQSGICIIEFYTVPKKELHYWEEFFVWKYGSISQTTRVRESRLEIPKALPKGLEWTEGQHISFDGFFRGNLSHAAAKTRQTELDGKSPYLDSLKKEDTEPDFSDFAASSVAAHKAWEKREMKRNKNYKSIWTTRRLRRKYIY